MSATRTGAKKRVDRRDDKPAQSPHVSLPHPFKPRRGLFAILAALNGIWILVLIVMYVKTVRHAPPPSIVPELEGQSSPLSDDRKPATRPGASGLPSAPR